MAGYQFIHFETYGHQASALAGSKTVTKDGKKTRVKAKKIWNAREILAEMMREDGACGHVESPIPPIELHGKISDLVDAIDSYEVKKGVRKDTPIMIAGVISAPWPPGDPRGEQWKKDSLDWLKKRWGDALKCVVVHADETYDHMHFYVTNNGLENIKNLHPGMLARAACGDDRKAAKAAYTKAMEGFQDDFFNAVSIKFGHARKGPGLERLSRAEWRERQDGNKKHAELMEKNKIQEEEIRQKTMHLTDLGGVERLKRKEIRDAELLASEIIREAKKSAEKDRERYQKESERLRLLEANLVEREKALEMKLEYATKLTAKLEAEAKKDAIEIIARIRKMGPR